MNGLITLRIKDLERLKIIERLARKQITQQEAAKLLNVTDRQIRNIFNRYKHLGDEGVISKKLDKASNRKLSEYFKNEVLRLIAQKYPDFGPTLVAEKLQKVHGMTVAMETVRQLR